MSTNHMSGAFLISGHHNGGEEGKALVEKHGFQPGFSADLLSKNNAVTAAAHVGAAAQRDRSLIQV